MRSVQSLRAILLHGCIAAVLATPIFAQRISTTAGGWVGDGGPATNAGLNYPRFALQDSAGNTYLADAYDNRIRKIDSSGNISTFAGTGIAGYSGDGGLARNAMLYQPTGLLWDASGNMLVADSANDRIRKIDTSGIISTIAGIGTPGYSGDGGPAILAQLNYPWGLALDSAGNLFFAETSNNTVRKIDTSGNISTVAGNGTAGYSGDGGQATSAQLNNPRGFTLDSAGDMYIADTLNHRVRKVDTSGIINTFAGNGTQGFTGDGGLATDAEIGNPRGLLVQGNRILISNGGSAHIRTVNLSTNIINSYAGNIIGYDGDGNPPHLTDFDGPTGMLVTSTGSLLVADQFNARLREVSSTSTSTVAGSFGPDNSKSTQSVLILPFNIGFDPSGNYYIAEDGGQRIRMVNAGSGQITTIAGNGTSGYSGDGGPATQAQIYFPQGVAADGSGNVYIADAGNGVIRKVTGGIITTYATDPTFADPVSMAADRAGNVYVSDDASCVIYKIAPPNGTVSVVAGNFTCGYNGDGIAATSAQLNTNFGVAVDIKGNLYIGDTLNNRIRMVNKQGIISTIAGTGDCGFSGDGGSATSATICNPLGVAADTLGNVYFADEFNLRFRKISKNGKINTIAGSGNGGYNGENLPAVSTNLDDPIAVGIDNVGTVFLLDDVQARVRKIH
jgi:sugar lactone lactonase YvrE